MGQRSGNSARGADKTSAGKLLVGFHGHSGYQDCRYSELRKLHPHKGQRLLTISSVRTRRAREKQERGTQESTHKPARRESSRTYSAGSRSLCFHGGGLCTQHRCRSPAQEGKAARNSKGRGFPALIEPEDHARAFTLRISAAHFKRLSSGRLRSPHCWSQEQERPPPLLYGSIATSNVRKAPHATPSWQPVAAGFQVYATPLLSPVNSRSGLAALICFPLF